MTKDSIYSTTKNPKIVRSENNIKFTLLNNDRKNILIIKVDGGVFPKGISPKRCDYFLVDDSADNKIERNWCIFIELKGTRVPDGIKQLDSTIKNSSDLKEDMVLKRIKKKYAYLVTQNTQPEYSTKIQRAEKDFLKDHDVILIVKNSPAEHPTHLPKRFK